MVLDSVILLVLSLVWDGQQLIAMMTVMWVGKVSPLVMLSVAFWCCMSSYFQCLYGEEQKQVNCSVSIKVGLGIIILVLSILSRWTLTLAAESEWCTAQHTYTETWWYGDIDLSNNTFIMTVPKLIRKCNPPPPMLLYSAVHWCYI